MNKIDLADICKTLSVTNRVEILKILAKGELTVNELAAKLNTAQPVISQHLRILRIKGFVNFTRRGTRLYYKNNRGSLKIYNFTIDKFFTTILRFRA